jgi:hypothetical protein
VSAIRLIAEPEAVKTGADSPETTASQSASAPVVSTPVVEAGQPAAALRDVVAQAEKPVRPPEDDRAKEQTSLQLRRALKRRAQTAVLRTGGYENGYRSFAALIEGALERELERLQDEFNAGEPFPENEGGFRIGRPLGS